MMTSILMKNTVYKAHAIALLRSQIGLSKGAVLALIHDTTKSRKTLENMTMGKKGTNENPCFTAS
jgi:hypothetical protein